MEAGQTQGQGPAPTAGFGRILKNTAFRAIADVGSKVASIALYVVMARRLGDAAFGVFTLGIAFGTLVTSLANMGQQEIVTREVVRDRSRIHAYFANTLALQLTLGLPALLVSLAVGSALGFDAETRVVVLLLGLAVVAEALATTCFAVFQGHERLGYIPVVLLSQRWTTAAIAIAALAAGGGVQTVAAIYLAGAVGALALALYLLIRRVARPRFEVDVRRWLPLMRVALPIGIAIVFQTVLFRLDIAMLGWFKSDAVVGRYGAAYRLLDSTLFISWSIGSAAYPVFSRLTRRTETPIAEVFQGSLKLGIGLTAPLAVGAATLAYPLMELVFGAEYRSGALALVLLAPTILLYPITYLAALVLVGQGRQHRLAWVYGAVAVQNLVFNLVLIPAFSLNGAAVATSVSEALSASALLFLALRVTGRIEVGRVMAGPLLATAAAAVPMATLGGRLALAIPAAVIVYVGSLAAFERRLHPDDYDRIRRFLKPRPGLFGSSSHVPEPERL